MIQIVPLILKSLSIFRSKFAFNLRQKTNSISKEIENSTSKKTKTKTKNFSNKKITLIWSKTTKKKSIITNSIMKTTIRIKIKTRVQTSITMKKVRLNHSIKKIFLWIYLISFLLTNHHDSNVKNVELFFRQITNCIITFENNV